MFKENASRLYLFAAMQLHDCNFILHLFLVRLDVYSCFFSTSWRRHDVVRDLRIRHCNGMYLKIVIKNV